MGLFDIFKKNPQEQVVKSHNTENENDDALINLVKAICDNNSKIVDEMRKCQSDVKLYYNEHTDLYEEWGADADSDDKEILLITLVDLLEKENIVCIRDWKDEKTDFIYFVQNLTGYKRNKLSLEEDWLEEDGDITTWADVLSQHWNGYHLAAIDMDSDSYVLFVCDTKRLKELMTLGENAGIRIDTAKNI